MNPLTLEWVEKAEGDLLTASREYRVRHEAITIALLSEFALLAAAGHFR